MNLFGTSGIRGHADHLFTNQFCFDLGITFSEFLDNFKLTGPVAIGMDPRGSSPRILEAIEAGLIFTGRLVYDQGMVPVPAMNNILRTTSYAGSIMVTGSHIASDLNGVKFFFKKGEILKEHEQEIENIYGQICGKNIFKFDLEGVKEENKAADEYEEMLVNLAEESFPQWRIVVDAGDGAQSEIIPRVLSRLGLNPILVNTEPQEGFIARDTETNSGIEDLVAKVKLTGADLGIGFDADGDRVIFVDENASAVPGDYSGTLVAKYTSGNSIVTTINTSQVIDSIGKTIYRTKVGSPNVIAKIIEVNASFGFEPNGGGISPEIMLSRDGGSTMIKILRIMRQEKKKLGELINEIPKFYLFKEKLACPKEKYLQVLEAIGIQSPGIKTEKTDGLKIWVDEHSWTLYRPSSNAPEFRVFAESPIKDVATKMGEDGIRLVRRIIG